MGDRPRIEGVTGGVLAPALEERLLGPAEASTE